jgi:hypothetical protein
LHPSCEAKVGENWPSQNLDVDIRNFDFAFLEGWHLNDSYFLFIHLLST